jgi:NAD(P)-dependent dehydrogenase (short-subunit alcohol dehydrogenase family)
VGGMMLEGRVALVTGGGTGIGRAAARLFAREGAAVVVANRTPQTGEETVQLIVDEGGRASFVPTDVSRDDQVQRLIQTIVERHGRLDCAFNNGGIDGPPAEVVACEEADWDQIIGINLKGTYLLMKHEIRQMLTQGKGAIVNMASVTGFIVRPNRIAYNVSRHGVIGATKTAALEYARKGIRVNAVAPGSIRTAIYARSTRGDPQREKMYAEAHALGRIGEPQEVAEAALWLCSDRSSFVVGHTLLVDGGMTLS